MITIIVLIVFVLICLMVAGYVKELKDTRKEEDERNRGMFKPIFDDYLNQKNDK